MGDGFINIDLNEEPTTPARSAATVLGSWLSSFEASQERIEERIHRLRAVIFGAQQRQVLRLPRSPSGAPNISTPVSESRVVGQPSGRSSPSLVENERAVEDGAAVDGVDRNSKRGCADLVAKALATDSVDDKNTGKGNFFDCNICLDMASDPILTCCGHLFCWLCFYQSSNDVHSNGNECPVCKREVGDTGIIPIYGNGNSPSKTVMLEKAVLMAPPRPQAHRVESVRQQLVTWGMSDDPIEEAMAVFSDRISAIRELHRQIMDDAASFIEGPNVSQVLHGTTAEGNWRNPYENPELLLSALNSFEVEPDMNFSYQRRTPPRSSLDLAGDDIDSFSSIAAVHSETQTSDTAPEINSTMPQSTSSSRRTAASRSAEAGSGVSRGPRRRRLR